MGGDTTNTNSGNDENPKCTAKGGTCANKYKHTCSVSWKSNLCSGGWSNKCCVGALKKKGDTTNTNSGNDENPKCTARGGTCADKNKDKCSGNWKRGLCRGGRSTVCCIGTVTKEGD